MPAETGNGAGRSDVYYSVIRNIENRDWNEFARGESYLGLPQSVIDDIQHDFQLSIKEQKYQMLVKWEQRRGQAATIQLLLELQNRFQGKNTSEAPSNAATQQSAPTQTTASQPQHTADFHRQEHEAYRRLLVRISRDLTDNLEELKVIYEVPVARAFANALQFLMFLENEHSWGRQAMEGKLASLRETLLVLGRDDHHTLVLEHQNRYHSPRAFMDQQDPGEMIREEMPSATTAGRNSAPPSQPINVLTATSRTETDNMSSGVANDGSFPTQPSSSTEVQERSFFDTSAYSDLSSSPSTSSFVTPSEGIVQRLVRTHDGNKTMSTDGSVLTSQATRPHSASGPPTHVTVGTLNVNIHGNSPSVHVANTASSVDGGCLSTGKGASSITEPDGSTDPDVPNMCSFEGKEVPVIKASKSLYDQHHRKLHEVYAIKSEPKGRCLILSNTDFPCWGEKYFRGGGEKDCTLMENLFSKKGLGLSVEMHKNKNAERMWYILENFSKSVDGDICVVIIMSHGGNEPDKGDVFYGSDGKVVPVSDVIRLFDNDNCENMHGKPKLLFFQFCRGRDADKGVKKKDEGDDVGFLRYPTHPLPSPTESLKRWLPLSDATDGTVHRPTRSDLLIAYATQEGSFAFRSWFTNAIANVFSQKAHKKHVCEMLNEVKRGLATKVSSNKDDTSIDDCKVMADIRDVLLKQVYFFPGFP